MRSGPNGAGLSRKAIFTEIDHSLRRLGTDYVDLYQIHRHDPTTPMEETLEALHDVVKAGKVRYLGASSMKAWEFAKALHLQERHGWARYRSGTDGDYADLLYTQAASDRAIVDAVGAVAEERGVSRAQVALAWLRSKPVVTAPIVGATKASHLADAVASLEVALTAAEIERLEAPYTPREDWTDVSDPAVLAAISQRVGIAPADDRSSSGH
jgi:aryl-alcohol dehydrogenase-like predicted oxidoreductase